MSDRRIGAAQFKERCPQLLEQLSPEGLVITKRGKPIARVIPFERSGPALIGALKGKIRVRGDLMSTPLVTRDKRIRKSKLLLFA